MRDLLIHMTHRPGELARITNALSFAGVNIKSLAAISFGSEARLRLMPDDIQAARTALQNNHIRFEEHELVNVLLENQAGELTGVAAKLSEAGLNLEAIYVIGASGELIELAIAVDDPKKAKKLLE